MKYAIVYWSRYGNGKRVVDYLAEKLRSKGEVKIFKTDEINPSSMPEANLYIFSAPTEIFNIQRNMRKLMKKLEGMEGKKYAIINTHGMKNSKLHKMEKILSKKKMVKIAEVDFKVGKDASTGNGLMDGWERKIEDFASKL
jgi:flavodoxin